VDDFAGFGGHEVDGFVGDLDEVVEADAGVGHGCVFGEVAWVSVYVCVCVRIRGLACSSERSRALRYQETYLTYSLRPSIIIGMSWGPLIRS
jgi:hypothetical protein